MWKKMWVGVFFWTQCRCNTIKNWTWAQKISEIFSISKYLTSISERLRSTYSFFLLYLDFYTVLSALTHSCDSQNLAEDCKRFKCAYCILHVYVIFCRISNTVPHSCIGGTSNSLMPTLSTHPDGRQSDEILTKLTALFLFFGGGWESSACSAGAGCIDRNSAAENINQHTTTLQWFKLVTIWMISSTQDNRSTSRISLMLKVMWHRTWMNIKNLSSWNLNIVLEYHNAPLVFWFHAYWRRR